MFIAASIPDSTDVETLTPPTAALRAAMTSSDDGHTVLVDPDRVADLFYADCEPDVADAARRLLRPHTAASFNAPPPVHPAWRTLPTTYVVCENDRAIAVEHQRVAATRADTVITWPLGHPPFLSQPDRVAALLAKVAKGLESSGDP